MKKYVNFFLSFISSKFASIVFVYILYNFHGEEIWKAYALYLVNISLFRNITFSFTSNLGHEGLLTKNNETYKKLFSTILFIIFSLQTTGLLFYFLFGDFNSIVIYSYLFAVVSSLQGLVQNYHRFSLQLEEYSKSTLFFSFGNLIVVGVFYFNSLETYLMLLVVISTLLLLKYFKTIIEIVNSFDFNYFKNNIKKLSISSLKLYLINTFPDSLFIIYVPLIFSDLFSNVEYAALVFLISQFSIKSYPVITLIIQKKMDLVKKFHSKADYLTNLINNFCKNELMITLLIISLFLVFEIFYIFFFAKPLIIAFAFFGFVFWILPLIFLRSFVNSIIEVDKNIKYKISSFLLSLILIFITYYTDSVNIFNIVIIYWINLMHLSIKHIRFKFLTLKSFFNFYINYFILGVLFHLNYLINLQDTNNYLIGSILIVILFILNSHKFFFNELKKIKFNAIFKNQ